jgi:hypothetical protein
MKKQLTSTPSLEKLDFNETWEDHPFVQWVVKNGKTIVATLLALTALLIIILRFVSGGNTKAEADYFNAAADFTLFQNGQAGKTDPASQQEAFEKLQTILGRRPELHAKYDGLIAQTLLINNENTLAATYENLALNRTNKDHLPYYADYARNTLLIADGQYESAIQNAEALQQKMIGEKDQAGTEPQTKAFGDKLWAMNLLRIAMLNQQIGNAKGELQAWANFKAFLGLPSSEKSAVAIETQAFDDLMQRFREGKITLIQYIEARERSLKS